MIASASYTNPENLTLPGDFSSNRGRNPVKTPYCYSDDRLFLESNYRLSHLFTLRIS
jgi:hypothetical protein